MSGTLAGTIDTRSFSMEVTEYDWSKINNVIYEHNGAVLKTIPANHLEQAVSFILEWNGLRLAFSGDTLPNKWWIENTQGFDFVIHEAFLTPELAVAKWGFSPEEAMNALTKIHATAALFGKVMAMTNPKHAVAYHFQNDADTLPGMMDAVQQVYGGTVDYAQDFMVWNITKDGVRTRMAVPNRESFPTPPLAEKVVDRSNPYKQPEWIKEGWPQEVTPVVERLYEEANEAFGTDLKPD
jgi:ribonuclease Z